MDFTYGHAVDCFIKMKLVKFGISLRVLLKPQVSILYKTEELSFFFLNLLTTPEIMQCKWFVDKNLSVRYIQDEYHTTV